MEGMILQIAGQVGRVHASARPRERNDLGALWESGQKPRFFQLDRTIRMSLRPPRPT
jgi:hypothetical protein